MVFLLILTLPLLVLLARWVWDLFFWLSDKSVETARAQHVFEAVQSRYTSYKMIAELNKRNSERMRKYPIYDLDGKKKLLTMREISELRNECFAVLGLSVSSNLDKENLKRYWRKKIFLWHPDKGGNRTVWQMRLRAYQILLDDELQVTNN